MKKFLVFILFPFFQLFVVACGTARTSVKAVSNADQTTISISVSGNTAGGSTEVKLKPAIDSNKVVISPYVL